MTLLTFEQFQATRKEVDDVQEAIGFVYDDEKPIPGFVYDDSCYIEKYGDHQYYLLIGREDWIDGDLSKLERLLYNGHYVPENAWEGDSMSTLIQMKIRLARAFGSVIQGAVTRQQFRDMVDRNKAEPEDSGICHSHDFCDANMYMLEAFQTVFLRDPDMESDDDRALWNDAWAIAKAADFFA